MKTIRILVSVFLFSLLSTAQDQAPKPQLVSKAIGESALTVPANSFKDYPFTVPSGLKNVMLLGHFKATGGAHNDIVVCIMTDDQFVNWRNRPIENNPIKPYFHGALYDSHEVTQGTIRLPLLADSSTYHLVFYNGFSLFTPKAVVAKFALEYAP